MREITINKNKLLGILKDNRKTHHKLYLEENSDQEDA